MLQFLATVVSPVGEDDLVLGTLVHEAHDGLGVDQLRAGQGRGEGEALEQTNQKQKQLMVSQLLTKAVSLAERERDESLIFLEFSRLCINKPLGVELFWRLPMFWVVHDP